MKIDSNRTINPSNLQFQNNQTFRSSQFAEFEITGEMHKIAELAKKSVTFTSNTNTREKILRYSNSISNFAQFGFLETLPFQPIDQLEFVLSYSELQNKIAQQAYHILDTGSSPNTIFKQIIDIVATNKFPSVDESFPDTTFSTIEADLSTIKRIQILNKNSENSRYLPGNKANGTFILTTFTRISI